MIKELLNKPRIQEMIRFVITGIFATLISYLLYYLFLNFMHRNLALTLSYGISFIFNFILSNRFTFKTKPNVKRGYRFTLAHLFNYLLQLGLLNLFVYLGISETIAILPTYMISIPVNYLFVRLALKPQNPT
jgi:putative flippase GtrA